MKIGIYDPYLDDLGGGEKYMVSIAESLSEKHAVTLFWDRQEEVASVGERFSLNLAKVVVQRNIFSPQYNALKRITESRKYDAMIILSDGSIPFVLSKKLFLHIQQPLSQISSLAWKERLKLRKVNAIFYNSEFTKLANEHLFRGVKNFVIYPPVETKTEAIKKENIILHVGRFRLYGAKNDDYKKQQVMVRVFKEMVDKGLKNWKFVVATSIHNQENAQFKEMLASAQGYPIQFLINKSNKELWHMYNRAKIYWHASGFGEDLQKHPEYAEHFGIATVEAMSAGVVPVVINAGGQKEIVIEDRNGFLWNSLEELQEFTDKLINDEVLWKRLSDAARKKAEDFTKQEFTSRIEKMIIS